MKALKMSASSSMKNWMQRQALAPFNTFVFIVFSKTASPPPSFNIRMGNGRETLVQLDAIPIKKTLVTVNAFTVSHVLKRPLPEGLAMEMENARYLLIHGVPLERAESALEW